MNKKSAKIYLIYIFIALLAISSSFITAQVFLKKLKAQDLLKNLPIDVKKNIDELKNQLKENVNELKQQLEKPKNTTHDSNAQNNANQNIDEEGRLVQGSEFDLILEPYNYDANGRRDPFQKVEVAEGSGPSFPLLPLEKFDLSQVKLTGIIWDVKNPKAMFMDPNDKVHILTKNQRIGRNKGYIAVIREGEVVVVEAGLEGGEEAYTTKILRIFKEN